MLHSTPINCRLGQLKIKLKYIVKTLGGMPAPARYTVGKLRLNGLQPDESDVAISGKIQGAGLTRNPLINDRDPFPH